MNNCTESSSHLLAETRNKELVAALVKRLLNVMIMDQQKAAGKQCTEADALCLSEDVWELYQKISEMIDVVHCLAWEFFVVTLFSILVSFNKISKVVISNFFCVVGVGELMNFLWFRKLNLPEKQKFPNLLFLFCFNALLTGSLFACSVEQEVSFLFARALFLAMLAFSFAGLYIMNGILKGQNVSLMRLAVFLSHISRGLYVFTVLIPGDYYDFQWFFLCCACLFGYVANFLRLAYTEASRKHKFKKKQRCIDKLAGFCVLACLKRLQYLKPATES